MPATGIVFGTAGIQTDGLVFAGNTASVNKAYSYNGTTFAEAANLANSDFTRAGAGSGTSAFAAGGDNPGAPDAGVSSTEEFNKSTNSVTAGAWASASGMNTGRARFGAAGAKDSALAIGGYTVPGNTTNTEKYDGTSWTETGNTPETLNSNTGFGSQTAALSACGQNPVGTQSSNSITFDGSSWSSAPAVNVARVSGAGSTASPYNSSVFYGGYDTSSPHYEGQTEEFNGSSWSTQNAMPTGVDRHGGGGTQTAAIASGGINPGGIKNITQFYDGTNWTTGPATLTSVQGWVGYAGTQTDNFIFGGSVGPNSAQTAKTQAYDGTAWSTRPSLGTGRYGVRGSGQGTSTSASAFGGLVPSPFTGLTNTEEFTPETESANISNFTTS